MKANSTAPADPSVPRQQRRADGSGRISSQEGARAMNEIPFIDWNGDGKVDPIETGLTFQLMQEEQDRRRGNPGGSGCLTAVMTFVIVIAALVSLIL